MKLSDCFLYLFVGIFGVYLGYSLLPIADALLFQKLDTGDLATWFAAAGTILTLAFLINQHRQAWQAQKVEKEERKKAEAEQLKLLKEEREARERSERLQREELKKEREAREGHEAKQREMWEEQVELQRFQKFQFHKSLTDEQLRTIELKYSGRVKFIDKPRLYSLLFPQNSPLKVDLVSSAPDDGFHHSLAQIIDLIVKNLLNSDKDNSREILEQFNILKTSLGVEFSGSIKDGGFSLYSKAELDINLFDPLMTFKIMSEIAVALINFSAEPGIHFASNTPYGKVTTRLQDFIVSNKQTKNYFSSSLKNEDIHLLFYMKRFLINYDVVENCRSSEHAKSMIRSIRYKGEQFSDEDAKIMSDLFNLDVNLLDSNLQLFIEELNSACSSKDNALSYIRKHGGRSGVAKRFQTKLKQNKQVTNDKSKIVMQRYLRFVIYKNSDSSYFH